MLKFVNNKTKKLLKYELIKPIYNRIVIDSYIELKNSKGKIQTYVVKHIRIDLIGKHNVGVTYIFVIPL